MKVQRIEIYHAQMPLLYPWRTAYGEDPNIDSVLVKISTREGDGWGESTPFAAPAYSSEWAAGAFALVSKYLAPRLMGQDIEDAEDLLGRISMFKGNPFAKASVELAWWVLEAKRKRKPLHELLGGKGDSVSVGADYGVQDDLKNSSVENPRSC